MANIKDKSRKHNCNENIQITSFIMNEECRISFWNLHKVCAEHRQLKSIQKTEAVLIIQIEGLCYAIT